MPFGASALLVPDVGGLRAVHHASDYLNRPEDEAEGQLNLVGRSLDTSRRFDALKVLIALRATGRRRLGEMVDAVLDLTQYAAEAITQRPELELVAPAGTIMVAFRHAGGDEVNIRIHRELFASGAAVIGRTRVNDAVALKLTLMNPATTPATSTPCSTSSSAPERHRQLDGALQAGRVRDGAGDPDRLQSGARLGRKPQAQRTRPARPRACAGRWCRAACAWSAAARSVAAPPCSPGRTRA